MDALDIFHFVQTNACNINDDAEFVYTNFKSVWVKLWHCMNVCPIYKYTHSIDIVKFSV